jgi:hypothetical protein
MRVDARDALANLTGALHDAPIRPGGYDGRSSTAPEHVMATRLTGALKREIAIAGAPYTLTVTPEGFRLVPKGRRNGHALTWAALVSGDAALAAALQASLESGRRTAKTPPPRRARRGPR